MLCSGLIQITISKLKIYQMGKPVSQPCLRNQDPIFNVLSKYFTETGSVLELASGTAQHAVYCSQRMPHLNWQPTEHGDNLNGAKLWVDEANLKNLNGPIALDINQTDWLALEGKKFEYAYCANLIHFVPEKSAKNVFAGVSKHLQSGGLFAIYGPVNDNGFTSEGNASLDAWLKVDIHPEAGIKELASIEAWAKQFGLTLMTNEKMPANNYVLVFRK